MRVRGILAALLLTGLHATAASSQTLRAPRPGTYQIRIERLGYETHQTGPYVLAAGAIVAQEIGVPGRAIVLPMIEASGENRCRGRSDLSGAAAAIWGEVGKTLAVATWTSENERFDYEVREEEFIYDRDRRLTKQERNVTWLRNARSPYESRPAEDLMTNGFVQPADIAGQWVYYGPDADVLQSDLFLDAHCFRPTTDPRQPGLVGLAFEPTSKRANAGLHGTIWIDKRSYGLHHIDFMFDWLPQDVPREPFAGGCVDFLKVPGGGWIVPSWMLRVPMIALDSRRKPFIDRFVERSRAVTAAFRSDGTPVTLGRRT